VKSAFPQTEFTAHNIELEDGSRTIPGQPLLRDWGICRAALRSLRLLVPIGSARRPPRVADLGCLEGGYAVEFARCGYDVVGIEGRRSNVDKCELVARRLNLPNLSFVHDDARNIRSHGSFDAVFCCGLLYHLDQPVAFLRDLSFVTRRLLLLHTHYATADDEAWSKFPLSPLTVHEGRLGRWFQEWEPGTSPEDVEMISWAAVGNSSSFWLEKRHLLQTMIDVGFPIVCEQYDFLGGVVEDDFIDDQHRSFFLGIKVAAPLLNGAPPARETADSNQDLPETVARARSLLDTRAIELRKRETELRSKETEVAEYARESAAEVAALNEYARALEHELRSIKATRMWQLATRWWRLRAALRFRLRRAVRAR
jgi:SAM-dependent methyltransferase